MMIRLKYGNTNTFLVRGKNGALLVDTDYAGTLPSFYKALKAQDILLSDITYVLATHYHPDHIGLVSELMRRQVKLLLMDVQAPYIHFADRIFDRDRHLKYQPISLEGAAVIPIEESRAFLQGIGIEGEIVHTPSHSQDSVSLILDTGECLVGDLEPFEYLGGYAHPESLQRDWEKINRYAPKAIYYAHINPKLLK